MNALEQRIEREGPAFGHHDLAVEHEVPRLEAPYRLDHLGEIAHQRFAGFRLQRDNVAPPKRQAAKAVPFRLVLPFGAEGDFIDRQRLHGREWGTQRTSHHRHNADGRLLAGHRDKNFELSAVRPRW
jgi:hypothetical protein